MAPKRRLRNSGGQDPPSKIFIMDETVAEYIRRTVLRIPRSETPKMLASWGFLSETQLQTLKIHHYKEKVSEAVVGLCEENQATIKDAAELDLIYNYTYQDKNTWIVYQMTREDDEDASIFNWTTFQNKFKCTLLTVLKNATISFKEYEDNAVWIRIAWGTPYTRPNQYKPTYIVYHSQTPYVFITNPRVKKNNTLLFEALLAATNYKDIHEMGLRSHCLESLKVILFKRSSQNFQTHLPRPLQEKNSALENVDPRIILEDKHEKERIQKVNWEIFGDGPQPKLENAQYKLETVFKSEKVSILNTDEPFRCMVKFSSPHLLEALKALGPSGIADAPLSPLLTCITRKARNYFKIREKKEDISQTSNTFQVD
ncbi:centromere protein N isoform X2 [Erythrolamprus reginae]|uniref:centromere protein N isoform X2 n=1 Tax=Erythrolamprus reginae TaxID=121349 RepID=UPI00396C7E8F